VNHAIDSADEGAFANFLLDAFRSYLVLHLSGERCGPQLAAAPSAESDILTDIDETLSTHGRPRLSSKERTASRRIDSANTTLPRDAALSGDNRGLWKSTISRSLIGEAAPLRAHSQSGRPIGDTRPPDWAERLSHVYARMSTWSRNEEPSVDDYLRERAILLEMLVDVIPSGADRLRALGDVLAFLKSDGRQIFDGNLWASRLRAMIDTCRNSPVEWDWLLRALLDSGDPVMRLYAQLEQLPS